MLKRFLIVLVFLNSFVLAAGGIDKVNSLLENISVALYGTGTVVLTLALMWAAFKVMWQHQTIKEVAPVVIGGVLIGSASAIAGYLMS